MKFLFLFALFFIVLWLVRKVQISRARGRVPPATKAPERMVKCAYCGVNQPVSESILTHGRYFCCPEHRHEAERVDG